MSEDAMLDLVRAHIDKVEVRVVFKASDVGRRVDARWLRARHLAETRKRTRPMDDESVMRARGYLVKVTDVSRRKPKKVTKKVRKRQPCTGAGPDLDLKDYDPHMFEVLRLYYGPRDTRFGVEAEILADKTAENIASGLSVDPGVVQLFEELFFDLRDRLDATSFISREVLSDLDSAGNERSPEDIMWKKVAFWGGAECLRLVMMAPEPGRPLSSSEFVEMGVKRLAIITVLQDSHGLNPWQVMKSYEAMRKISTEERGGHDQVAVDGVNMLLDSINYSLASVQNTSMPAIEERVGTVIKRLAAVDEDSLEQQAG